MLKNLFSATLCVALVFASVFNCSAVSVSAESAVLVEAESGDIVYEKNAHSKMPMASTTKIMSAIVAIENGNIDDTVTITDEMVGAEGSSIYLKAGEKLTLGQLLYALLLQSANDSAEAIAIHISGSVEKFAELMNQKANELNLVSTHFTNPHGLDDEEHYTTAYELATITAYALKNDCFKEIVSTYKYTIPETDLYPERVLVNHNKLLKQYKDAIGVKTGFTKRCGRCLVTAAERDGLRLIAVTLSAPDDWNDHKEMLDYGFSQYKSVILADTGSLTFELPVVCGEKDKVQITNREKLTLRIKNDNTPIQCKIETFGGELLFAPIEKGSHIADAVFYKEETEIARLPLYATENIESVTIKKGLFDFFDK